MSVHQENLTFALEKKVGPVQKRDNYFTRNSYARDENGTPWAWVLKRLFKYKYGHESWHMIQIGIVIGIDNTVLKLEWHKLSGFQ